MNYDEHRQDYERKHPASIPKLEYALSPYPNWLKSVVLVMFITAASGSGVHTIPTVYAGMPDYWPEWIRHIASIASFTYIELAIFVAIFALIGSFSWLTVGITTLATGVATVANIYSVANAYKGGDIWALVVSVALGIVAPGVALMSGKMFVNMHRADRMIKAQGDSQFREACIAWDKRIEIAFKAHENKAVEPTRTTTRYATQSSSESAATILATRMIEAGLVDAPNATLKATFGGMSDSTISSARKIARGTLGAATGTNSQIQ